MYALHALLDVVDGRTDEASLEVPTLEAALAAIRELVEQRPNFRAVTLMHVEDLPLTLQGATDVSPDGHA